MKIKKRTIGDLLLQRAQLSGERNSIGWIEEEELRFIDFSQYKNTIEAISLGLRKLGLKRRDRVGILGKTCKEWHLSDMAVICSGAAVVPVYHTYTPKEVSYILQHSETKALIVEDEEQLRKAIEIADEVKLKCVVVLEKVGAEIHDKAKSLWEFHSYDEVLNIGREEAQANPDLFERVISETPETEIASIIYTSGTTGEPKGAVVEHRAFAQMLLNVKKFTRNGFSEEDRTFTFLPLSHVFGRADSLMPLIFGWECVYANSIDTIIEDIALARPTVMLAVPRIFEKIYAKVLNNIKESNPIKQQLFEWAIEKAKEYYAEIDRDKAPSTSKILQYQLAYKLVFKKIYDLFGGRVRFFISGGAPLSKEIIEFLRYADLTILEGYGLTETVAPCALNPLTKQVAGSVGQPTGDVEISFGQDGEILVRSEALFTEYLKNKEETEKALDSEGWFHTGDIGHFTVDGYLKITDRKKDIIITSGGKNVAPQKIENLLKIQPHISHCVVVGDNRKYLTALIGIEKESFLSELEDMGLSADMPLEELVGHPEVTKIIRKEVDYVNKSLAKFETIKKFHLMPIELSTDNYLTPSLKVKKKSLIADFGREIDAMYQN